MIEMNDPDELTTSIGRVDPIEVLDPPRWRRPWTRWDPWGMYLAGHQEKTAARLLTELRAVACETRKRIVNNNDVDDQYFHTLALRAARAELNRPRGHRGGVRQPGRPGRVICLTPAVRSVSTTETRSM